MKIPAIYTITNSASGKVYVGSSQDSRKRLYVHRWKLRRGNHDNVALQRAWDKDGEEAFNFAVVEEVIDIALLIEREQFWIDKMLSSSAQSGYNFCPVAGTRRGTAQPQSVSDALRAFHTGKPKSAETRAKMSASAKGRAKSAEHRAKISAAVSTRFADPEERRKASERQRGKPAGFKGRHHSAETIAALRAAAQARYADIPRKPRIARPYVRKPKEEHLKAGPRKGTPRQDRRGFEPNQVREIRSLKESGASYQAIALQFDSDASTIFNIVKRRTYADVE